MLSAFCEVGGGFSILKKCDFREELMPFLLVYANVLISVHLFHTKQGFRNTFMKRQD